MTTHRSPRAATATSSAADRLFIGGCVAIYLTLAASVIAALNLGGF